jgi:hypothetical protein
VGQGTSVVSTQTNVIQKSFVAKCSLGSHCGSDPADVHYLCFPRPRERTHPFWRTMRLKFVSAFAAISIGILAISVFVAIYPAAAKASVGLDQCATLPNACSSSNSAQWQNGNLGQSNSSYFEGDSVPYRATFSGLTIGETYSLLLEWDTTQSGKHAIDTLTSYNRTIGSADYCAGITCSGSTSSLSIPSNPNITAEGVGQTSGQAFALTGGTFPASEIGRAS